jgi:hypothetical protein
MFTKFQWTYGKLSKEIFHSIKSFFYDGFQPMVPKLEKKKKEKKRKKRVQSQRRV